MGLNLSNRQIAHELDINEDDAQQFTRQLRQGVVAAATTPCRSWHGGGRGGVSGRWAQRPTCRDTKMGHVGRRRRRKGRRGRGIAATDRPPTLDMIARGGQCFLRLCSNVQQTTIQPWITKVIQQGSTVNTDEHSIYARLPA